MQFGAPSILFGLVAAAIPWLVHLIGKRRAVPVKFAAMQLLLRSEKRISARRRLRELLLLLARTAIAAALPLIFARPFTERAADVPAASLDSQAAVLLLDDSASLGGGGRGGEGVPPGKEQDAAPAPPVPVGLRAGGGAGLAGGAGAAGRAQS